MILLNWAGRAVAAGRVADDRAQHAPEYSYLRQTVRTNNAYPDRPYEWARRYATRSVVFMRSAR